MAGKLARFMQKPDIAVARENALEALGQDAAKDATSSRCIPPGFCCSGSIVAKSSFVLCGIAEADTIFASRQVKANWKIGEGQKVKKGATVCLVTGRAGDILACERTALDYLSLLSGIAAKARLAAEKYGKWKISATRKTIPLLSSSEKRAVAIGGCLTHRLTLADGILIKDNHIAAIMKEHGVGEERAVEIACGSFGLSEFVEVEVSSEKTAMAAALSGASAILVDNVSPVELKGIAAAARKASPRIIVEASGGITLANAGKYLAAGADFCSTSELTMKVEPADLSLEIDC